MSGGIGRTRRWSAPENDVGAVPVRGPVPAVPLLNVAATRVGTAALGPGWRSAVWVQGCPLNCRGCLAPDWIPDRPARQVAPAALASELLADPAVDGLTFSGGEPMAQAAALAELARLAREIRDISLVCFTGFTLDRLRAAPPGPGVDALLAEVDVLVDGPYVAARNNGRGLRGSTNQTIHHLTGRLESIGYDFADRPRTAEVRVDVDEIFVVGVPPPGLVDAVDVVAEQVRRTFQVDVPVQDVVAAPTVPAAMPVPAAAAVGSAEAAPARAGTPRGRDEADSEERRVG